MIARLKQVQPVVAYVASHLDEDVSLAALAEQAGLSPFHLHRIFAATARETPKQFTLRLRLGRAAVLLLTGDDSVLDVALSCGFQSHEAFLRAFRRRFGITPSAYRARGFAHGADRARAREHASTTAQAGPCIALYHIEQEQPQPPMSLSISKKTIAPQPVLVVRRRIPRSAIAATIGEALPQVFGFAQRHGIALAGLPFARYSEAGHGLITIEPGMRISGSAGVPAGDGGDVIFETLPGGPVATAIHTGPYDRLPDAYAQIEQWIEAQKLTPAGAPWECYLTDPGEVPDPKDWKTEIFWPVKP